LSAHLLFSTETPVRDALVCKTEPIAGRIFREFPHPGTKPDREPQQRRDTGALSTLPNQLPDQASLSPAWKQEVNRRLAQHKSRKASSAGESEGPLVAHPSASGRAAAAAARVAARYAKAPSYSEILAEDARAAVRAAEAASRAAIEAQAAAESVLAGLEAAQAAEPVWEVHSSPVQTSPVRTSPVRTAPAKNTGRQEGQTRQKSPAPAAAHSEAIEGRQGYEIRWEPDMPVRPAESAAVHATVGVETPEEEMESARKPAWQVENAPGGEAIEVVEPALPIHANLIEFPREIVATRKVRPRLVEGPLGSAPEHGAQLSIFEVDPGAISTEPIAAVVQDEGSAPAWTRPEWSGIELDAQPRREYLDQGRAELLRELELEEAEAQDRTPAVELAPVSRRLMAAVVNGALIAGASLGALAMVAEKLKTLPTLRGVEIGATVALVVVGTLYQALFYGLSMETPGMKYAQISLCTLDGETPTRARRLRRLAAMLLSVLPLGLGVMWSIFDEDHLSWHDRLSGTYLRKIY
jgi:uncharacterized RDD family membrane protein YckC